MHIEITHLTKGYKKKQVLKDVNLNADGGTCIGILGVNGSGKSTLLSILAGVIQQDSGSFLCDGKDLFRHPKLRSACVGYVPQGTPLLEELTAWDNLRLWYDTQQLKKELDCGILRTLGVTEFLKMPVNKLSGGMKKRLAIGCAVANRYILYNDGTAEEAVAKLGFQIYRTDQMLELVEWMHDYNMNAEEGEQVRLYGFDMQRDFESAYLISDFYSLTDAEKAMEYSAKFDTLFDEANHAYEPDKISEAEEIFNQIVADLEEKGAEYAGINEEAYAYALQGAKCMLQDIELQTAGNYSQIRDENMAENVKWIYEREQEVYGAKLMIAGHNGHVAKAVSSAYTNMGFYLHEELGEEYFVIGTDFYKTTCNLPTQDGRADYDFCSDDPLAAAVGGLEGNVYYLDFAEAATSTDLAGVIEKAIPTGSLGESYSPLMEVMKNTYQIRIAPGELYNGMIFVYEATPIAVWDYQQQ